MVSSVPNRDRLVEYLTSRIEESVFIESDPDVVQVVHKGKKQPARIIEEQRGSGVVRLQLLHDRSFMVLTYDALKAMMPGAELVSALDAVNNTTHASMP
tara:strand:+ start:3834 stop:4130 length:297 start_codon:yes stop_codon:yes gene_type:complete